MGCQSARISISTRPATDNEWEGERRDEVPAQGGPRCPATREQDAEISQLLGHFMGQGCKSGRHPGGRIHQKGAGDSQSTDEVVLGIADQWITLLIV
jgi:hypothetical protein